VVETSHADFKRHVGGVLLLSLVLGFEGAEEVDEEVDGDLEFSARKHDDVTVGGDTSGGGAAVDEGVLGRTPDIPNIFGLKTEFGDSGEGLSEVLDEFRVTPAFLAETKEVFKTSSQEGAERSVIITVQVFVVDAGEGVRALEGAAAVLAAASAASTAGLSDGFSEVGTFLGEELVVSSGFLDTKSRLDHVSSSLGDVISEGEGARFVHEFGVRETRSRLGNLVPDLKPGPLGEGEPDDFGAAELVDEVSVRLAGEALTDGTRGKLILAIVAARRFREEVVVGDFHGGATTEVEVVNALHGEVDHHVTADGGLESGELSIGAGELAENVLLLLFIVDT